MNDEQSRNIGNHHLVKLKGLNKHLITSTNLFGKPTTSVKGVDEVNLTVEKGETLGIVGESGCGKSTLGNTIIRLLEPTEGSVYFEGEDIYKLSPKRLQRVRKDLQMIFQDP